MIIKENEFKTLTGYTLKELKIDFLNRVTTVNQKVI